MDNAHQQRCIDIIVQKGSNAVAVMASTSALDADAILIRCLTGEGMGGIVVCMDRSPSVYEKMFADEGIDGKNVYLLDATGSGETGTNIVASGGISDLTTVGIDLFNLASSLKKGRAMQVFVLFDAVASAQWYNDVTTVARFLHNNNLRFRTLGIRQIYVLDPKSSILPEVMKFCDKMVDIEHVLT